MNNEEIFTCKYLEEAMRWHVERGDVLYCETGNEYMARMIVNALNARYESDSPEADIKAGSLVYDEECGEGLVEIPEALYDEGIIMQLDVLKDWIEALTSEYNTILADFERRF